MNPKLTTLSSTHSRYKPEKFLPLSDKARAYIAKLPVYKDLPRMAYRIPDEPGAYCLPLDASKAMWEFLSDWCGNFVQHGKTVEADFFKSIPGVADISIQDDLIFHWERCGMFTFGSVYLNGQNKKRELFCPSKTMRFEPTIAGALAAFYFEVFYPKSGYGLIYCSDKNHRFDKAYGEALSAQIPIPWGFRIEIIEKGHYLISCLLHYTFDDLHDINVEVKNGKILHGSKGILFDFSPQPPEYRPSILLLKFKDKDKIIY